MRVLGWLLMATTACDPTPALPTAPSSKALAEETARRAPEPRFVESWTGGARPGDVVPALVALHGLGDRPEAFCRLFTGLEARARVVCPAAFDPWGPSGRSWFALSDDEKVRAASIAAAAARLAEWLPRWRGAAAPVVTGFSQGGMLSLALAARHGHAVRAAVAVGGALPAPLWPESAAGLPPVVVLHGAEDRRVPLAPTLALVEAWQARGGKADLEVFPGVGHHVPPELRARWLRALAVVLSEP